LAVSISPTALEKTVEKDITEKVATWNWEINLEEPYPGIKPEKCGCGY
jgi:hypothetical protein